MSEMKHLLTDYTLPVITTVKSVSEEALDNQKVPDKIQLSPEPNSSDAPAVREHVEIDNSVKDLERQDRLEKKRQAERLRYQRIKNDPVRKQQLKVRRRNYEITKKGKEVLQKRTLNQKMKNRKKKGKIDGRKVSRTTQTSFPVLKNQTETATSQSSSTESQGTQAHVDNNTELPSSNISKTTQTNANALQNPQDSVSPMEIPSLIPETVSNSPEKDQNSSKSTHSNLPPLFQAGAGLSQTPSSEIVENILPTRKRKPRSPKKSSIKPLPDSSEAHSTEIVLEQVKGNKSSKSTSQQPSTSTTAQSSSLPPQLYPIHPLTYLVFNTGVASSVPTENEGHNPESMNLPVKGNNWKIPKKMSKSEKQNYMQEYTPQPSYSQIHYSNIAPTHAKSKSSKSSHKHSTSLRDLEHAAVPQYSFPYPGSSQMRYSEITITPVDNNSAETASPSQSSTQQNQKASSSLPAMSQVHNAEIVTITPVQDSKIPDSTSAKIAPPAIPQNIFTDMFAKPPNKRKKASKSSTGSSFSDANK